MKYVYIAAPYTHNDPVINTAYVISIADDLVELGYIPFVPHLTLFWHFLCPHEIDFWYEYDLAWLDKCDCLLRLEGESTGADKEVEIAHDKGKPIYFSVRQLVQGG